MKISASEYRDAAMEYLVRIGHAFEAKEFFIAHCLSGVAVECMLRAYLRRISGEFEPRHDVYNLAKRSGFFNLVPGAAQAEWGSKLSTMNSLWRSEHRYCSLQALRRYLTDAVRDNRKLDTRAFKGDLLEHSARMLFGLALEIVSLGEKNWR